MSDHKVISLKGHLMQISSTGGAVNATNFIFLALKSYLKHCVVCSNFLCWSVPFSSYEAAAAVTSLSLLPHHCALEGTSSRCCYLLYFFSVTQPQYKKSWMLREEELSRLVSSVVLLADPSGVDLKPIEVNGKISDLLRLNQVFVPLLINFPGSD